jgi:hypothetical protein
VDNFRVQGEGPASALDSKYAIPAGPTALTPGGKNALGISQGPDPAKWMSSAQAPGPMQTPQVAALGQQNDLPSVDAAGNAVPWTKDVGGSERHGIDFCIRGLEKQRSEDIRAIAAQMR